MPLTSNLVAIGEVALREFWLHSLLALVLLHFFRNRYKRHLVDIPGPFLASLSNLWLLVHCNTGRTWREYELHRKYQSPLVRIGPNTVSVADSEAIRIIYGYKPVFQKGSLYITHHQINRNGDVVQNLSSTRDEKIHAALRRPVAHAYALSTLVEYEPLVDSTFATFVKEITERFVETRQECDLARWLQMYAFDIIGELTFSKRLGFLETGTDVNNMMFHTGKQNAYAGMMGAIPVVDELLRLKNPILRKFQKLVVIKFTTDRIQEHVQDPDDKPDFVTQFIKSKAKYADIMTEDRIADFANTNVAAGSDTTAIALRELVYQILTRPQVYNKVMMEIRAVLKARSQNENVDRPITWAEGSKMTYYQACIKECLRYHPALGQILPRDVPDGGIELCGHYLPRGTTVGCNAWTVHRDKALYGEDADDFRPERWIEGDPEQIRKMGNLSFWFGAGPRVCIGKNIAMLEITKFVPEFLRRFDVRLVDPARYKSHPNPGWLVPQSGLDAIIELRSPEES